jgi:hypothetical protein
VGFDLDAARVETDECMSDCPGEHVATLDDELLRVCARFVPIA